MNTILSLLKYSWLFLNIVEFVFRCAMFLLSVGLLCMCFIKQSCLHVESYFTHFFVIISSSSCLFCVYLKKICVLIFSSVDCFQTLMKVMIIQLITSTIIMSTTQTQTLARKHLPQILKWSPGSRTYFGACARKLTFFSFLGVVKWCVHWK